MDFHSYPPHELIGAKVRRSQLEYLARKAMEQIADFVGSRTVALSLSFGKDSMVCLDLTCRAGLLDQVAMVLWCSSGIETPDTIAMRDYVVGRYGIERFVATVPPLDTVRDALAQADLSARNPIAEFVYQCLERPRWAAMDAHAIDGTILGLRASESKARRMNFLCRGDAYWNRREKAAILTPIVRWETRDVFEYCALHDVPLHPIYDLKQQYGFDRERIRLNTLFDLAFATQGDYVALKGLYPETYRQVAEIYPAIRDF